MNNLPLDATFLHQLIRDLLTENETLKAQLALLKAKTFGSSSEKTQKAIEDLELRIEENDVHALYAKGQPSLSEPDNEAPAQASEKGTPKRKKLPEDLPRKTIVLEPNPICPGCGSKDFRKISDDISEVLDYIPSSFIVKRTVRPRCACCHCETIVQADLSNTIDKGKAGPGLLAHVMIQKYADHLPLYRQSEIFEREGIDISRSTMAGWVQQCSRLLDPLMQRLRDHVFSGTHIHGDDTIVKVLAPDLGKTKTGRIWTYVRDERPCGDPSPPAACYFYSPDRTGERPREHLKTFTGVLHADAYSGYDALYKPTENQTGSPSAARITEAACWAHARRKFYEVTVTNDKATIALGILNDISEIYRIEADISGLSPEDRVAKRQELSKPLVLKLFKTMETTYSKLPPKGETAKAIAYALNLREALQRFLDDGRIDIDNNAAERALRSIAVGRKNWLFAGSDRGGVAAANFYTLIETLKLNNMNPWTYLQKVFDIIQDHHVSKLDELLPWNIKLE